MYKDVLLYTNDIQKAKEEIELLKGRITQQFSNTVFVAQLSEFIELEALDHCSNRPQKPLDEVSQLMVNAWLKKDKRKLKEKSVFEPSPLKVIKWDTKGFKMPIKVFQDSDVLEKESIDKGVQKSTGTSTSLYMRGSITVGLVIVSGDEEDLIFSDSEKLEVVSEVMEALTFLSDEAPPDANVSFIYNIRFINVNAQSNPSGNNYEECESVWRDPALQQMGYNTGYSGCVDYSNDLRSNNKTNWSFVAFITKYPLFHFAYAGGVRLCMEYANDGWGPDQINKVFAHETCHIFGAADEYGTCTCSISGYYNVPNRNCVNCTTDQIDCLMNANTLSLCFWSRGQIGWSSWEHIISRRPKWSDKLGWDDITNYSTIQTVAVGRDLYLLGRANKGMHIWRFNRNNNNWSHLVANNPKWADNNGWSDVSNYSTIQGVAVNGELYLLARANAGMHTWKFNSNNNTWLQLAINSPVWADNNGWSDVSNYSTIQAVEFNNELYLLARANAGMHTWKFNTRNNSWSQLAANSPVWADNNGWSDFTNYSTIQAIKTDSELYLLARANKGIHTWKFDFNNNNWIQLCSNNPKLSDDKGWRDFTNYSTIQAVSLGEDLYLLARANAGINLWKFNAGSNNWNKLITNDPVWSDKKGWRDITNFSTIQIVAVGEELYLLGRANAGIHTLLLDSEEKKWIYVGINSPKWSDDLGWNDVTNCSTIQSVVVNNELYLLARANAGITTFRLNRIENP